MKIAEFKRYKYMDNKREMFAVWLRIKDESIELFHGSIVEYRAYGWERCATQLVIDSMKVALTMAGYDVIGGG